MYPSEQMISPLIRNREQITNQNLNENDIILMERIRKQKMDLINHRISPAQVDLVRPEIVQSWIRSYNNGLDPYDFCYGTSMDDLQLQELLHEKEYLLTAADPYIKQLESMLSDTRYLILLSDEKGTVLQINPVGNQISGNIQKTFRLATGTVWNEETVGTVSHVMSLMLGSPIQLCGPEIYSEACSHVMGQLLASSGEDSMRHESLNQTSCSSAPIFDAYGNLAGSITIISPYLHHQSSHTLGLAVSTAWAIQNHLQLALNSELFDITIDAADDAVITINQNGIITKANVAAQQLFEAVLTGSSADKVFGYQPLIASVMKTGEAVQDTYLNIDGGQQRILLRSAQPLQDHSGKSLGCVLTFKKLARTRKIKGQVTGLNTRYSFDDIIGFSSPLTKSVYLAKQYASLDANILIQGESGTGKEMYAQAIHNNSRPGGSFIAVNCAAIPRTLIESELFGYEGGSFTGAERQGRPGKVELAHSGTLFLDEIGDMPLELQPVLLRVLEEKMIMRVGGSRYIPVNFRLITATNKSLSELVAHNLFREDLYYRLAVLQIPIPPLRQRGSDIIELAKHFAGQIARQQHKEIPEFSDEAIFYLLKYHWPGNVRQLENVLLCAVTANRDGIIKPDDFPLEIMEACTHNNSTTDKTSVELTSIPGSLSLKEMEKIAIIQALQQVNFNITQAARILGMSKSTLYRKINAYNLLESIRSDN